MCAKLFPPRSRPAQTLKLGYIRGLARDGVIEAPCLSAGVVISQRSTSVPAPDVDPTAAQRRPIHLGDGELVCFETAASGARRTCRALVDALTDGSVRRPHAVHEQSLHGPQHFQDHHASGGPRPM
jgi:hypothetical protein